MTGAALSDRDLDLWMGFAVELADVARGMLQAAGPTRPDIEVKADKSFVTALDKEIEQRLRTMIEGRFPRHGILGEEWGPARADAEQVWVLDPIDGTAPFIAGMPVYGTLIALAVGGAAVVGIIDQPATNERWIGASGRPTRHGAARCRVRSCPTLGEAILSTSNPDFYSVEERPVLEALRAATAWRIYGGSCRSYGLLASGRTDVAVDTGFQVYDFAPFVPIVAGAGGMITDWAGEQLSLSSGTRILAAGHPGRHHEARSIIERALAGSRPGDLT